MKPTNVAEDLRMLRMLCARASELDVEDDDEVADKAREYLAPHVKPFRDMLDRLENGRSIELTDKQRSYVKNVFERVFDSPTYENLFSSGKLCIGKPVETPVALRPENLPKAPPGRIRK